MARSRTTRADPTSAQRPASTGRTIGPVAQRDGSCLKSMPGWPFKEATMTVRGMARQNRPDGDLRLHEAKAVLGAALDESKVLGRGSDELTNLRVVHLDRHDAVLER